MPHPAWMLVVACSLIGCSTPPPLTASEAADLPDDLVLDITVLPGRDVKSPGVAQYAQQRVIVFPDGSLRADSGPSIGVLTRPARLRILTREQMGDLWLIATQTGFGDPASAPFDGNPALLGPSPDEVLTIITVRANGVPGTFLERTTPSEETRELTPAARLIRAVERLAWASDEPPSELVVLPLRYDLGPDPYARYLPAPRDPRSPGGQEPIRQAP